LGSALIEVRQVTMGKSKSSSSDGLPLMDLIKPAVGVAVALAGYYFLQGIQTEVSIRNVHSFFC